MAGNIINSETKSKKGGILGFFKSMRTEVKRISWPSKVDTKKAIIAVATVSLIYTFVVGGFDYIFQNLFEAILKLK